MTKKALIKDGRVVNVIVAGDGYEAPVGHLLVNAGPGATPGAAYADGVFSESPEQAAERAAKEAARIAAIPGQVKAEAERRILAIAPEWKQRNMIAEGVSLLDKLAQGGALTADEQTTRTDNLSIWTSIEALRTKSDEIEARSDLGDIDLTDDQYWS